jgi:hypothetical protein
MKGMRTEEGEALPSGVIDKAKVIHGAIANLITLATSATTLALVPESARPYVLLGGAVLTIGVNAAAVFYATPKVTAAITLDAPEDDGPTVEPLGKKV